jgi:hypothetical protein
MSSTLLTVLQSQPLSLFCLSECSPLCLSAHLTGSGLAAGRVSIHRKQTGNMRAFVFVFLYLHSLIRSSHCWAFDAQHRPTSRELLVFLNGITLQVSLVLARSLLRPHPKSNLAVFHLECRCFPNHETISYAPQASRVDASDSPSSAPASTVRACCSRLLWRHRCANVATQATARRRVIADRPPISPDSVQLPSEPSSKK